MFYFVEFEDNHCFLTTDNFTLIPDFDGSIKPIESFPRLKMVKRSSDMANFMYFVPGALVSDEYGLSLLDELNISYQKIPTAGIKGLYVVNVISIEDMLDKDKSVIDYYSSGNIRGVKLYSLNMDKWTGTNLFKLPETKTAEIICSEKFVEAYKNRGLSGLRFVPIGQG